jgi:hypothetical protein
MAKNAGKASQPSIETEDSASVAPVSVKTNTSVPAKPDGKGGSRGGPSSKKKTESTSSKSTPGFAEGNAVLQNYGLSVSGYRERVLSPFKTDKYFHMVSVAYQRLLTIKPSLPERFTFEEFQHCSALQLYQRIENVKFDLLGVKPSATHRIPLPRNLRIFLPLWSLLSNIGYVNDEELRVQYIPDAVLPDSADLDSEHDIEGLLSCTLYNWNDSWANVLDARSKRDTFQNRDGYTAEYESNEAPMPTKAELISRISSAKKKCKAVEKDIDKGVCDVIDDNVYYYPSLKRPPSGEGAVNWTEIDGKYYHTNISKEDLLKTDAYKLPGDYLGEIEELMILAKKAKHERITPRFDTVYSPESYKISDGTITAATGAYGSRFGWDPQLWSDYENAMNEISSLAMLSMSMPNETEGTYAWLLPVEKRHENDASFCVKLPKASIPTQTWMMAMLLQSSTLPYSRRCTWYTETDYLSNLVTIRMRYINAAIKTGAPVDQFGTY